MAGAVMRAALRSALPALALALATPLAGAAQFDFDPALLPEVVPGATRFGERVGEPPVFEAYGADPATGAETLVGYAFVTADIPPEVQGYTAPITVLVGMDLAGTVTGIEILAYRESLMGSRGDFLNQGSYLRQYPGKHVIDQFRVRDDIDGISGATLTVDAMARGIRNAARRVAASYLTAAPAEAAPRYIGTTPPEELEELLWAEIVNLGFAAQVNVLDGPIQVVLFLLYLSDPTVGEMMVGPDNFRTAIDSLGMREDSHLMLLGLSGRDPFFFRPSGLTLRQDGEIFPVENTDLAMFPLLRAGNLQGEVRRSGLLWLDGSIDLAEPFDIVLDMGPRGETGTGSYLVMPPPPPPAPVVAIVAEAGAESTEEDAEGGAVESEGAEAPAAGGAAPAGGGVQTAAPVIDFEALLLEEAEEEATQLERVLERTSWVRVAGFGVLLLLATLTLATKSRRLRWTTLLATFLLLGFYDGGFLSVSHILAAISVGPSVFLGDLPLLMLAGFTVVTTLLWGRVFCGFLCPFGALQDLLERIVPRRLQRELPPVVHRRLLKLKYAILALILLPAVLGTGLTIFQYFEPFGTVFYLSSSLLLWTIAGGILLLSAIVPRFYCRYACPLGAALAVGSLAAPFRIARVEQCDFCKVCEQKCPTGAITGPEIDFKECVRCNTCEIQLREKTGVCRHDIEKVRLRVATPPLAGSGTFDV